MSKVVRTSKYRHVFGTPNKKEACIDDLRVTTNVLDSNYVAVNPQYWAVAWNAGGGGAVAIGDWAPTKTGKFDPTRHPLITSHKAPVLDMDFSPFNDQILATVSEDCYGKIFKIPDTLENCGPIAEVQNLRGHTRKITACKFNPTANNIFATSAIDYAVKIWDIETGSEKFSLDAKHTDIINNIDWSYEGNLMVSSCKDKKNRIIDNRANNVVAEGESHTGSKGSRAIWLGNKEKIFSCGFNKTNNREMALFDPRNMSTALVRENIDSSSGLLMPFYDNDTCVLFLAGKGDGNIRYYELVDESPYIHFLTEYKANTATKGMAMMPKRGVDVSNCEVVRMVRLVNPSLLEPIAFVVPRKSDLFQADLYPPAFNGEPTVSSSEWISGKHGKPKTVSLENGFVQKKVEVKFEKKEEAKPLTQQELQQENDKLQKRVAYLEAELVKKETRIKELEKK